MTLFNEIQALKKETEEFRRLKTIYEITFFSMGFFSASLIAYIISFYGNS